MYAFQSGVHYIIIIASRYTDLIIRTRQRRTGVRKLQI